MKANSIVVLLLLILYPLDLYGVLPYVRVKLTTGLLDVWADIKMVIDCVVPESVKCLF